MMRIRSLSYCMRAVALAVLVAAWSLPTSAATLFAGNQSPDFSFEGSGGTGYVFTATCTTTRCRSDWVPEAMRIFAGSSNASSDPPSYRYLSRPWTSASSSFWVSFRFVNETVDGGSGSATTSDYQLFRLLDGGVARLMIRGTGTTGQIKLSKRNSAGTFTDLATSSAGVFDAGYVGFVPKRYDIAVTYAVSGSVTVYQNGVSILSYSGDVTTDSATTLDQIDLATIASTGTHWWSEVIVNTADTRNMGLYGLRPAASGTTQQWTPNTVGNIAKSNTSDVSYISTATNDHLSGWTTPTTLPTGTYSLLDVVQFARVQRSATGPQNFAWYCRSGGTNAASSDVSTTTAFASYGPYVWSTNCATAAAWAIGDITTGFNLGVKSRP